MKVVIAGGSGFLGRALSAALLAERNDVVVLTRTSRAAGGTEAPGNEDASQKARATPVTDGRATPVTDGRATPVTEGRATPVTDGRATPVIEGRATPVTDGRATPVIEGRATPVIEGRPTRVTWTPDGNAGEWAAAVDGADVVVNLAGESIAGGRWTAERKKRLVESRILATRSLVAAIRVARRAPAVLLSVSGQNYYGHRGDEPLGEAEPPGHDFLARLCVQWEGEARQAEGVTRVVLFRTGIVLSAEEGALPQMLLPFRMFAGGPMGSGRQFMSWIHWRDWVGMARWAMERSAVSGPLNVAAPTPVRNREFARAIGNVLQRPSLLPAPAVALRLALGEMAEPLLLASIRMVPARALELGYRFHFTEVEEALRDLLSGRQG